MKIIIKKLINSLGYDLSRLPNKNQSSSNRYLPSMQGALWRIREAGVVPQCIVDIGAAAGKWTENALLQWPEAQYELIEPLEEQMPMLKKVSAKFPNARYHMGIAGSKPGKVLFSISNDLDGSGVYGENKPNTRELSVLTVDSITYQCKGPFLLKLDTHGYEVPILEGAENTLQQTEAMVIEVYGFYVSPTGLLFHQLSTWLEKKGFRLYDIVDVMRRQKDSAFWQADAVYLKADHKVFQDNAYR